jgi:uncharacterized protein
MRYSVFNCTRQTLVASELEVAETGWSRMKGLIGRSADSFMPGKGLWILPSEGVHTIGMAFPIDVAYLNSEGRIIHSYHRLVPNRIACIKFRAKSVLELPAGILASSQTEIGDLLFFSVYDEERGAQCAAQAV